MLMKISKLIKDFDFYPREQIDSYNVNRIVDALEAKAEVPPILIDKKSKRVIDGFHRCRAYQKLFGENAEIPVKEKSYSNEQEMFIEAMRLNSIHGRRLTKYDEARCVIRAEELKIAGEKIAAALSITHEKFDEIKKIRTASHKSRRIPIKQSLAHLAGKRLTEKQLRCNEKAGGMNPLFYVNQLINFIEADALDMSNENLQAGLRKLHLLITNTL